MKYFSKALLAICSAAISAGALSAQNYAWPANYEGVMLQGFFWDSYEDTKWTNLESQADELSEYFKLIWIPNSAWCGGTRNMGYMPQYWFTNHKSAFGSEEELRSMIDTFKGKGTGIIADVVVNHRNGVNGWYDFPVEEWNGRTWSIGLDGICSNDEMASNSSQPKPTGAPDTGDNFDGCRDLDHTNTNVQDNVKNYCKFLLEDLGYAGFRYDMVKGYAGKYTKIYNEYAKPTFSVGEYWDGNVTSVTRWIDATGKQSAAFDFPQKYAVNNAFHTNNLRLLVSTVNGAQQPSGLIKGDYRQYSVTFVDNHDTYRDGSRFNGNVGAANAFILCSPGTPCVFLPHWKMYKNQIKRLIRVRNAVGVNNMSQVTVLKSAGDVYMARVTGTKGELVVRIGSTTDTPEGYTDADIKTQGNGYCVWTKTAVNLDDIQAPQEAFTVYFDNADTRWTTPHIHYWGGDEESTYPGEPMTRKKGTVWEYTLPKGTTQILFNDGNGDDTKTGDYFAEPEHIYTTTDDLGVYEDNGLASYPPKLYLLGNLVTGSWKTNNGVTLSRKSKQYSADLVELAPAVAGKPESYFTFVSKLGTSASDWNTVNSGDRFGAMTKDEAISVGTPSYVKLYAANTAAGSAFSWKATEGKYSVLVDLDEMTVLLQTPTAIDETLADPDEDAPAIYYNLQGVRVDNPVAGPYIRVRGSKVEKIYIR